MSHAISIEELPRLQDYCQQREEFRNRIMVTKKSRYVAIGDNVSLLFENRDTVLYQVLEMLRIEKTTAAAGIQEELDAYNPLIPDGNNWKATMLIEFPDEAERRVQLKYLRDVEHRVWCEIDGQRLLAIADEDMERSDSVKTSAVHFLRFQLDSDLIRAAMSGADIHFGIDHDRYHYDSGTIVNDTRDSLLCDLAKVH